MNNPSYILIVGTNKAATTSLFRYLADHNEVCASYIKQTNYFLDVNLQERYNLRSIYEFSDDFRSYYNFFRSGGELKYRVEASPDYMYDTKALVRIKNFLSENDGKIVLILRNPVSRFKSWYNFGKQQGLLNQNVNFSQYYELCKNYNGEENLCLLSYKTGFYSDYLKFIKQYFDDDKVNIFFYEDLIQNPKLFMQRFSRELDLDLTFYDNYDFKHHNKTIKVKYLFLSTLYTSLRSFYIDYLYKGSVGVKVGDYLRDLIGPLYRKLNASKLQQSQYDNNIIEQLKEDYNMEKEYLRVTYDIKNIPW